MTTAEFPAAAEPPRDATAPSSTGSVRSALATAVRPYHPIQNRTASIGLLAGAVVTATLSILSGAGILEPDPALTSSLTTLATFALTWAIPCDGPSWESAGK